MKRLLKRGKQYFEVSDSGDYFFRVEGYDLEVERFVQDRDFEFSVFIGVFWFILLVFYGFQVFYFLCYIFFC